MCLANNGAREAIYLCNVVEKIHQYFRPKMRQMLLRIKSVVVKPPLCARYFRSPQYRPLELLDCLIIETTFILVAVYFCTKTTFDLSRVSSCVAALGQVNFIDAVDRRSRHLSSFPIEIGQKIEYFRSKKS